MRHRTRHEGVACVVRAAGGAARFGAVLECRTLRCGAGLARTLSLNSLCYVLGGAAKINFLGRFHDRNAA
jgi:hypothetical protein